LKPLLRAVQGQEDDFSIKTYTGVRGYKQMLWNELSAQGDIVLFSGVTIDAALSKRWAEKYRKEIIDRNVKTRSIENFGVNPNPLSDHADYTEQYQARYISQNILDIRLEISIYNDIIAIYNSVSHDVRLGTEIKNPFLAVMLRQIFEHYWSLAAEQNRSEDLS
jgi:hypothetical protein